MGTVRIAELRRRAGMTQQLLAERAGVSIRTVQKLEAGADPRMGTVAKLARALNVSIGELFGETAA